MLRNCTIAVLLALPAGLMVGQDEEQKPQQNAVKVAQREQVKGEVKGKGLVLPKDLPQRIARSWEIHGKHLSALPHVTAPTWDCRTLGYVTPIDDQGSCGSCWDVSATGVLATAWCKAGWAKNDGSFNISPQYIMDNCGPNNGGCNGDDASTPINWALSHGIPTTQDYGPYTASSNRCRSSGSMKLWKIDQVGYCSDANGISPTQAIKDAIVNYGPISSAVNAGGFSNYSGGIMGGDGGPGGIDHDVSIAGWDDTKGSGCWLVKNQWGTGWGENGYGWIPYGKWQIGYAALWVHAPAFAPPPPPPPPPGPIPPVPGQFTPPFKLYEAATQIGDVNGYLTLDQAHAWAVVFSNNDKKVISVMDAKGATVETIQPGPIPPGPTPNPTGAGTFTLTLNGPLSVKSADGTLQVLLPTQVLTGTMTVTSGLGLPTFTLPTITPEEKQR